MNKFEPTPEQWGDILKANPPSPEQNAENLKRKQELESGFGWEGQSVDTETRKATAQEERSERLISSQESASAERVKSDKSAAQRLLEKIRGGLK